MSDVQKAQEKGRAAVIVVNTKQNQWDEKEITFEQVVELAFPDSPTTRPAPRWSSVAGTGRTSHCARVRTYESRTE